ncbi:hypothetical protein [Paraburkholderia heleia]|uniref:hypothetical protein n=1 Tax=Paraburkholderia heleia TaxID=634127 RepID=UPI002AB6E5FC|nr:hypothetical protein [Paraburkholderia heleia]
MIAVVVCSQLPIAGFAQQYQPPNNVDLLAAYCVPILKSQLDFYQNSLAQPSTNPKVDEFTRGLAADTQQNLNHVQRYVLPRMEYLDPTALLAASTQGKEDFQRALADTGQCFSTCQNNANAQQCMSSCTTDTMQRVRRCQKLDWLPF